MKKGIKIKLFNKGRVVESSDDKLKEDQHFKLQDRRYFRGLDIAIENKKGSTRKGINDDGTSWKTLMKFDYGYIRKTESPNDGERVDVYLGPDESSDKAFIVNQNNPFTGKFDEQKAMLCFSSADEAKKAYLSQYDNPKFFGSMKEMPFDEFKEKALRTEKKPTLIKAFGVLLKAFGGQIGLFDEPHEVTEGEQRIIDGKVYEVRRSKKNPQVKRVFRVDGKEKNTPKFLIKKEPDFIKPNPLSEGTSIPHFILNKEPRFVNYEVKESKIVFDKNKNAYRISVLKNNQDGELVYGIEKETDKSGNADRVEVRFVNISDDEVPNLIAKEGYRFLEQYKSSKEELFNQEESESNDRQEEEKRLENEPKNKKPVKQKQSTELSDLFNQPDEPPARPETKDGEPKNSSTDKTDLIDNFGVTHLSEKVRKQRIDINKKVKELLASKKDDEMTTDDKKLLATYSGRGGTDEISLNEYYTPEYVAKFQWDMLKKLGFEGGLVLEPSCGTGVFLYTSPDEALITGVEYDETSSRIARILFPEHEVIHSSFEEFNTGGFDKGFSAAIGNVPFGPRGLTAIKDIEKKDYSKQEQYFLDRILDDINEDGVASIIVPTGIMDNQLGEYRLMLNKKAEFLGAIRMPTGVFKKANAQVTTDILFFKKRSDEVIERLEKLEGDELSQLLDSNVFSVEFINGSYFDNHPDMALGIKDRGQFATQQIWKGDITSEDLQRAGEKINSSNANENLQKLNINPKQLRELHVGDIIVRNGRTYRLNENHRWERVNEEEVNKQELSQDYQKLFGIKTIEELNVLKSDPSLQMDLTRDQLSELRDSFEEELKFYVSSNLQKNEMLKRAVILGLAIGDFQKEIQTGHETTWLDSDNNAHTNYSEMTTTEANEKAQKLAMLLDDFKQTYGHPINDAKLNTQMGKSPKNPILYLVSSFDSQGNLSKLFTDPKAFYNVYYPKSRAVEDINHDNILDIIKYHADNGYAATAEAIKSEFKDGKNYDLLEFKRFLIDNEDVFIDENGQYGAINEVCMGQVYVKLDYWAQRIAENKKKLSGKNLTDKEREYIVAENKKLEAEEYELKRRAGIRNLENLPVDLSDAGRFFDIKYLNNYLREKLGMSFKGDVVYNEKRHLFTFGDRTLDNIYKDYIANKTKGALDKQEKQQLDEGLRSHFNSQKNPVMLVALNSINGLSSGTVADSTKATIKDIQENFIKYLSEMADDREQIENLYNRSYNNFIQKEYDGSVIEGISKLDYDKVVAKTKDGKDITVREKIASYNWAVVRRMIEQKKGLIAHGVGLGKTLEAILVGLVAKETGMADKPTYVVPKSVIGNWVAEIKKWTKDTNVLIIGAHQVFDKDGKAQVDENGREIWREDDSNEKKVKLSRLVNENFDFILMTRNFYSSVKLGPQTTDNMLKELVDKFYVANGDETDKAAEKKREALIYGLSKKFLGNVKKDKFGQYAKTDEIFFENLGIDMVVSDEHHSNKNLIESVLYQDTKYLNNKYSDRAVDFYFKSKIIRNENNDGGVYGLTATPVSNSPLEVFNILLPIAEKQFEQMGINNVDDFVKKFGDMDVVPTMDAGAKIANAKVFKGFKQANLLRKMFFRYADYKTSDMVGAEVHFPKENPNIVFCDQSDTQKEIIKGLRLRLLYQEYGNTDMADALKEGFLSQKEAEEIKAYAVIHKQKAENIKSPFSDEEPKDYYFNILDDMKKATADIEWYSTAKSIWADPLPPQADFGRSPKLLKAVDSVVTKYKDNGKQLIFAENVNLHQKLKDELIRNGIPENEIFIVNSKTVSTSDKRLQASENYNMGKYKIIIGNYATMGEGLNFNIGTTDIHHLQPAWNALAIEQGNGRGIRQGNVLDKVNTHYYLTKGTVDAFFNQKILDKRGFVNELLNGTSDNIKLEDGDISADEVQIALAEDPEQARRLLQKKNEAFKRLMKEREVKQNFSKLDQLFTYKNRLERIEDKESLHYKTVEKDINKIKDELNNADDFNFEDIMDSDIRPIIIPGSNAVIKIGSIIDAGSEKGIISSYSHSTGKVKIKYYPQFGSIHEQTLDYRDFANGYNRYYNPSEETAEDYFNDLIENKKMRQIDKIEGLPKEIFSKHKYQILANLQKDGRHQMAIARKSDGSYVGTSIDFAIDHQYDLVFPQERADYFNIVEQAVKTSNADYSRANRNSYYSPEEMAVYVAQRIYGENWENKIKYLKAKAKGGPVTEADQFEYDEVA